MKISQDKKSVTLSIEASLSTTQLEALIAELAVVRASMQPEVPREPPKRTDPIDETARISVQEDPYLQLRQLADGRMRLYLRNQGLGWLVFNIPADKLRALRDYLIAKAPHGDAPLGLFDDLPGKTGPSH